ncbi:MAG: DNA polymerase III subunit gamma/tau [Nitrospirota bacterium]
MSYLVLARKWRPKGFDDLIGQEPITRILKNAISQNRIAHAYIFSGPRGVGKTSTARILAKALNCKDGPTPSPCGLCESCNGITEGSSVDVIEIDGASNNSVDDIRDLRERVKYAPSGGKYKVYIIDEAHMLSGSAFNALLKTLEEPPSHVIFVLATTALKKIPATVISRCQHMPFRRISSNEIKARLKEISGSETINISPSALNLIARAADGSMRDSLTILDQLSSFSSGITEENVKSLLGIADLNMLTRISLAIVAGNRVEILETINLLTEHGTDIRAFAKELTQFFRNLLVASVVPDPEEILDLGSEEISAIKDILKVSSESQLILMLSEIMKAENEIRNSSSPRLALEMALVRTSFLSTMKSVKEVIENLEKYGAQGARHSGNAAVAPKGAEEQPLHGSIAHSKKIKKRTEDISVNDMEPEESSSESVNKSVRDDSLTGKAGEGSKDILYCWERTLGRIEAPLASKISQARVELKGDELLLTLNGGHAVFEESIKMNLKSIEKMLSEESGSRIKIKIVTLHKKSPGKKDLKEKIMKDPVIREALELFEGRIVDVTSLENTDKNKNGGDHV